MPVKCGQPHFTIYQYNKKCRIIQVFLAAKPAFFSILYICTITGGAQDGNWLFF